MLYRAGYIRSVLGRSYKSKDRVRAFRQCAWLLSAVVDINIPSFSGHSYLQYLGLRRALLAFANIEIVFKATDPDGLILYNGYNTDGSGDFISLALRNGTLEYRFDLGTGPAVIRYIQGG